jgi:adenosylcobinamide kinase/adenosylcobinamide-phosphate guanylyltransferase
MNGLPQLILVLGGARSGKSTFAEQLAARSKRSVAFIATALASDEEMQTRIAHHRATRPPTWHTLEEPLKLAEAVHTGAQIADVLLLDCMTTWLGNKLILQEELPEHVSSLNDAILHEVEKLIHEVEKFDYNKRLIIVTNEVGAGIVPAYPLGRTFRDILGLVNQRLAERAARVYLIMAGLAVDIKRLHEEAIL